MITDRHHQCLAMTTTSGCHRQCLGMTMTTVDPHRQCLGMTMTTTDRPRRVPALAAMIKSLELAQPRAIPH